MSISPMAKKFIESMWVRFVKKLSWQAEYGDFKVPAVMVPLNLMSRFCKMVITALSGLITTFNDRSLVFYSAYHHVASVNLRLHSVC